MTLCNTHRLVQLPDADGPHLCPGCPACVPGRTWSGPLQEWAHLLRVERICHGSERVMETVLDLRRLGLSRHEAALALSAVLSAVEGQRKGLEEMR